MPRRQKEYETEEEEVEEVEVLQNEGSIHVIEVSDLSLDESI